MLLRLGLGLTTALVVALIALNAFAWSGAIVDDETKTLPAPVEPGAPPVESESIHPANRPQVEPIARTRPSRSLEKAKTSGTALILTATRGDCWVEVRAGSATGKGLFSGTLASGRSLRFNRPRLWLRLGAASNVDIVVNGRQSSVPSGTVELTLPDA